MFRKVSVPQFVTYEQSSDSRFLFFLVAGWLQHVLNGTIRLNTDLLSALRPRQFSLELTARHSHVSIDADIPAMYKLSPADRVAKEGQAEISISSSLGRHAMCSLRVALSFQFQLCCLTHPCPDYW